MTNLDASIVTTVCTTVVTVVTLIIGFLSLRKQGNATHAAVNSNLSLQQERNEQLTAALTSANVIVPKSPQSMGDTLREK
jgi:succinyl-CoA synthetase alpha subunit